VKRLVLKRETTDEAVGMLVRRFPTVESLEYKGAIWATRSMSNETLALSDKRVRAVSNLLRGAVGAAWTALSISCKRVPSLLRSALRPSEKRSSAPGG
jgi:hypothetical protein